MGFYIDPVDCSKEAWLQQALDGGRAIATWPELAQDGRITLCLVDNGAFTALGVCFNQKELDAVARPDGRFKRFFHVDRELVKEQVPVLDQLLDKA